MLEMMRAPPTFGDHHKYIAAGEISSFLARDSACVIVTKLRFQQTRAKQSLAARSSKVA